MGLFDKLYSYAENKDRRKEEKAKKEKYREFIKKLGLEDDFLRKELDSAIIKYLTLNQDCDAEEIILTEEQLNDPDFMYEFYKAGNESILEKFKPNANLRSNLDFLIRYLKAYISYKQIRNGSNVKLSEIIQPYKEELQNPYFISRLIVEFPKQNIIKLLSKSIDRYENPDIYKSIISKIPSTNLSAQASNFGKRTLKYIPTDYKKYRNILSSSIECDGLESLTLVPPQQLIEYRDLIQKALNLIANKITSLSPTSYNYRKETTTADSEINNFFLITNNPIQSKGTSVYHFSKTRLELLFVILNDKEFWNGIECPEENKMFLRKQIQEKCNSFIIDTDSLLFKINKTFNSNDDTNSNKGM